MSMNKTLLFLKVFIFILTNNYGSVCCVLEWNINNYLLSLLLIDVSYEQSNQLKDVIIPYCVTVPCSYFHESNDNSHQFSLSTATAGTAVAS